jgi:hypothetical protein
MDDTLLVILVVAAGVIGIACVAAWGERRRRRSGPTAARATGSEVGVEGELAPYVALQQRRAVEQQVKSGANWFYWIAGLSLVNSALSAFNAGGRFFFGLGVTQLTDALGAVLGEDLGPSFGIAFRIVAFIIAVGVAGLFALFGLFANRGRKWAFMVGMALYGLDALVFVWGRDYLSIALHAFALFGLFRGVRALGELAALEEPASGEA